ncbi:MAG: ABC transporter ATP-binding protein [Aquificae bacterium]|nr:ABC transporter ATP-binding protein [Aquificota bacterium]
MYSWKTIFDEIKKYKKQLVIGNLVALLAAIVSVPIPLFIPFIIDELLLNQPGIFVQTVESLFGNKPVWFYIVLILFIIIILRVSFLLLSIIQGIVFTKISKEIIYKIRKDMLLHLEDVSMAEYETVGTGKLTSLFITDINTIDQFLGVSISRLLVSLLIIIGVSIILLWIHWKLALFILLLNPIVVYFTVVLGRKVGKLKRKENKAIELFQEALTETLDLFWQIKASNREKQFIHNVVEEAKKVRDFSTAFNWKSDAATRISFTVFLVGYEIFRAAGLFMVAYSDLTIGLMFAIFSYLWVMMTPIQEILSIQYSFHTATAALNRINNIFKMKKEPKYPHTLNPFKHKKSCSIKLEQVYFSYDSEKLVLQNINMEIKRGQKVAVVGASGSGKTTLAHILVGFYPVDRGKIYYDDIPVEKIGLDIIRENVSLVLQTPMLFNDTVRFNLTLGKNIPDFQIWEALKIAQMDKLIKELPKKLDTPIGKNGIKLSGGQRQRLAIARMILQNPKIVILDESTSALDTQTEFTLFKELQKFLKDRTTIIIAHRLSTITQADYIYVLDKGKIVQQGTHEELMKQQGLYYTFMKKETQKEEKKK